MEGLIRQLLTLPQLQELTAGMAGREKHSMVTGLSPVQRAAVLKPKPDPEKEAQQRIIIAKLPEMERTLVALIRECRKRHLIVTPDALLRVARETVPDEIPNIGTILELLGALELKGVIERDAGILKLSSRVG